MITLTGQVTKVRIHTDVMLKRILEKEKEKKLTVDREKALGTSQKKILLSFFIKAQFESFPVSTITFSTLIYVFKLMEMMNDGKGSSI